MAELIEQLSRDLIERLTNVHIERYTRYLTRARHGAPGYREDELVKYLALWQGIKAKGCDVAQLTEEEKQELREALMDEG